MAYGKAAPTDVLPLPTEGFGSLAWWQDAITAAEKVRDELKDAKWKPNVAAYNGDAKTKDCDIRVNVDFYNTEQKKAQLFFRTPEMQLTAKKPGLNDAVSVFQPVVNHYIGPHKMNLAAAMNECLFDLLCPAGIFAVKIGYEAVQDGMKQVQIGEQPDPNFVPPMMPGAVLGLSQPQAEPPMVPILMPAPNIIFERYFIERVSPAAVILPASFHGSDYDKAPWIGWRFPMDLAVAKRKGWVPKDAGSSGEDTYRLTDDPEKGSREIVICTEVFYKAHLFHESCKHPERYGQLVFVDDQKTPAVSRYSKLQQFDEAGQKFLGGMKGNPLHVGAIRYVADSAYPPSDCTISRAQVDELADFRTQMQKQRRRSLSMRWGDKNRLGPDDITKLKAGDVQSIIMLDGNGNEILGEVARAEYPRENFSFMEVVQSDINKEWALSENTSGETEPGKVSATESSIIQNNIAVRQDYERTQLAGHVVRIVEKAASLIQLFADDEDYIEVVDQDGAKRLQAWDKTLIQGEFAYTLKPDSAQRVDAAADRKQWLDWTNFTAKSPVINQMENMRTGAVKFNLDPATILQEPEPPGPPPPNVSVKVAVVDLAGPAGQAALKILQQAGYQLDETDLQVAQANGLIVAMQEQAAQEAKSAHGGPAEKNEPLSKRSADQTGNISGAGTVPSQATVQ